MISWFKQQGMHLLRLEKDNAKLAFGISLAMYIAFSPFVGFHTIMAFVSAWLFGLNVALLLTVSMMINNPWTMMPVYGAGYWFGDWLLSTIGIAHHVYNPYWIKVCNEWLHQYISIEGFSFWAFMVGGNILGIVVALMSYLPIKRLIAMLNTDTKNSVVRTVMHSKQVIHSLKEKAAPVLQKVAQKARSRKTAYETGSPK